MRWLPADTEDSDFESGGRNAPKPRKHWIPAQLPKSGVRREKEILLYLKANLYLIMESHIANMLKKERHAYIIKQINLHNKVLSSNLSLQLQVSEDTVRRDLFELAEAGEVIKVHGGALSKSYHFPIQQNVVYAKDAKVEIAKKAVGLIKKGMIILTEAGTTMMEMVKLIPANMEATFFTVSPLIALELAEHPLLTVILWAVRLICLPRFASEKNLFANCRKLKWICVSLGRMPLIRNRASPKLTGGWCR